MIDFAVLSDLCQFVTSKKIDDIETDIDKILCKRHKYFIWIKNSISTLKLKIKTFFDELKKITLTQGT